MRACIVLLAATHATACSNAAMEDAFGLSIRTEDLGDVDYEFVLVTQPRGRDIRVEDAGGAEVAQAQRGH